MPGRTILPYNFPAMPVSATIDRDARLVFTTATGVLTRDDFIAHIANTWSDGSIVSFHEIVDARTADASGLSADDLAAIVNSGVEFDPDSSPRLALCVSSELAYGLGRMFSTMRETHVKNARQVQVFRDIDDALAWIAE